MDPPRASVRRDAVDQPIPKPLMIALVMIVGNKLRNGPSETALADRNYLIEALLFDGPHEAFRMRIRIGRLKWRLHNAEPHVAEQPSDILAPFPVAVTDQYSMVAQQAVISRRQSAIDLAHE
jgi:hypothetical protein